MKSPLVIETERLELRHLTLDDAGFIVELLNDPSFVRYIGDRGVRSLDDGRAYIEKGPLTSYQRFGFGLWLVQSKTSGEALGLCGLVNRDTLPDIDIGYAFLACFRGQGYAIEAALAVRDYAFSTVKLKRLVAIVDPANPRSIRVLEKAGLKYERMIKLMDDGIDLMLFAMDQG